MLKLAEILYWLISYVLDVESLPGGNTAVLSCCRIFLAENSPADWCQGGVCLYSLPSCLCHIWGWRMLKRAQRISAWTKDYVVCHLLVVRWGLPAWAAWKTWLWSWPDVADEQNPYTPHIHLLVTAEPSCQAQKSKPSLLSGGKIQGVLDEWCGLRLEGREGQREVHFASAAKGPWGCFVHVLFIWDTVMSCWPKLRQGTPWGRSPMWKFVLVVFQHGADWAGLGLKALRKHLPCVEDIQEAKCCFAPGFVLWWSEAWVVTETSWFSSPPD